MTTVVWNVPVARRQLLARRGRVLGGVIGIALALLLVLALKAIFAGLETRMTAYIDGSGADVIVAQQGIASMHMTESALPQAAVLAIRRVPGVASASGILYKSGYVEAGDKSGNKNEEAEGKTMKKKGHAIEKEGEARGDAAEQMEKSGNKAEKAGVESREKSAKAKTDSKK